MDRRAFLQLATAAVAGLVLDPERALWVPGRKTIFLPPAPGIIPVVFGVREGDVFTIAGVYEAVDRLVSTRAGRQLQRFIVQAEAMHNERRYIPRRGAVIGVPLPAR